MKYLGLLLVFLTSFALADTSITTTFKSSSIASSVVTSPILISNEDLNAAPPTPAIGQFLRFDSTDGTDTLTASGLCRNGTNALLPTALPQDSNLNPISLPATVSLATSNELSINEGIFVEILDPDQDLDSAVIDQIEVTLTTNNGEIYQLVINETAVDSGRFITGIQGVFSASPVANDCVLELQPNQVIQLEYTDPNDASDQIQLVALIEPLPADIFLSRSANKASIQQGEIIELSFIAENRATAGPVLSAQLVDTLPKGFSPIKDSIFIDDEPVSATMDGKVFTIGIPGEWLPGENKNIKYLAKATAGTSPGKHSFSAVIQGNSEGTQISNSASLEVLARSVFTDSATIVGEVVCDHGTYKQGVPGIRLLLDNGQYVKTDEYGRFHFSELKPGTRSLLIDETSFNGGYRLVSKPQITEKLSPGELHRVQFLLQPLTTNSDGEEIESISPITLKSNEQKNDNGNLRQHFEICIGKDALDNVELLFTLPDGVRYKNRSVTMNGQSIIEPRNLTEQDLSFYLGRSPSETNLKLSFEVESDQDISDQTLADLKQSVRLRYSSIVDPVSYLVDARGDEAPRLINGEPVWKPDESAEKPLLGILDLNAGDQVFDPIQSVRVRLSNLLTPRLLIDGEEISQDKIGFTLEDNESRTKIMTFVGVDFGEPGQHSIRLEGIGPFGNLRFEHELQVTRIGEVTQIEIVPGETQTADGETPIQLSVLLKDEIGQIISGDVRLKLESDDLESLFNEGVENRIIRGGNGLVSFDPVTESGKYFGTLSHKNVSEAFEIYIKPAQKPWIMVGFAEGTVGYQWIKDHLDPKDDHAYTEFEGRLFAQGSINETWLMTIAADSQKPWHGKEPEDLGTHNFSVFAANSEATDSQTGSGMLYVKMEKERAKWVFGSKLMGLQLANSFEYQRHITGVEHETHFEQASLYFFGGEALGTVNQVEFLGSGLSTSYDLNTSIKPYSESVSIEVRDRLTDDVLTVIKLKQNSDYYVDYTTGELFLRVPVMTTDLNLNYQFVVVEFETESSKDTVAVGGAEFDWNATNNLKLGASAAAEDTQHAGEVRAHYQASENVALNTTLAQNNETKTYQQAGVTVEQENWQATIELTHSEAEFGIQYVEERDEELVELTGQVKVSENSILEFNSEYESISEDSESQALLQTQSNNISWGAGLKHTEVSSESATSALGNINLSLGSKTDVTAALELNTEEPTEVGPNRLRTGVTQNISRGLSLSYEQELTNDGNDTTTANRIGLRAEPWQGAEFHSEVTSTTSDETQSQQNRTGGTQLIPISEKTKVDFGFDSFRTLNGDAIADYDSIFIGLEHNRENDQHSARLEYRNEMDLDTVLLNLSSDFNTSVYSVLSLDSELRFMSDEQRQAEIILGFATHNPSSPLVHLHQLTTDFDNRGNEKITAEQLWSWLITDAQQLSIHNGFNQSKEKIDDESFTTQLGLLSSNYRIQWNSHWDNHFQLSWMGDSDNNQHWSSGVITGYRPIDDFWIGLGYNHQGFDAQEFINGYSLRQGLFLTFRVNLNTGSAKSIFNQKTFFTND